ncbi:MAG: type II secretion system F family protein [Pirellulaceae bacterium]
MSTFQYVGEDSAGRKVNGIISAETPRAARDRLRETGVDIRRIHERADRKQVDFSAAFRRRRLSTSLTEFIREMATLLQAGVPLLEAIDCSLPQTKPALQEPLAAMRDRIAGGESLAEAMSHEAWLFDDMMTGMVRVGEHAGNLEDVLDQTASFREQSAQLQDRVISAVLYPAIVFAVSIAVTLFLMTVVVPMLLKNLTELGSQLPWPTRVLKFLSDNLLLHGWWIGLVVAIGLAGLALWLKSARGRVVSAKLMLRIPVFGTLIRKQSIGRIALVVACLLRSGIDLVEALKIAAQSCNNVLVKRAIEHVTQDIQGGAGLKEAISKHAIFPASVAQIFALGQQSGQLEGMLQRLGADYDRQAAVLAGRVTSIAEPLPILMLSVVVGFILFATVLPILEAGNVLAG